MPKTRQRKSDLKLKNSRYIDGNSDTFISCALHSFESESEVAQSCLTLYNPMGCSLPGASTHGIFQARILEWVALSFSRGSSRPRDWTWVSRNAGRLFDHLSHQGSPHSFGFTLISMWCNFCSFWKVKVKATQSCPTLCDPMDCSLPGPSIRGIFQARILEWFAISFLMSLRSYLIVVLICIFQVIRGIEYLFSCLLAICIFSWEKYLFKSFAPVFF